MINKSVTEKIGFAVLWRSAACWSFSSSSASSDDIFYNGVSVINWEFLSQPPREGMTQGGIFPAILGTFLVSLITVLLAVPLGMFSAIYLNEYAYQGKLVRMIRLSIRNLSGVPSIVYGLFGVALFVRVFHFGASILSAGMTLGLLTLPWTITASEEALKTVPKAYRDGALALGATKWQAIRTNVLPYAIPGMLTGAILGLARAAGETAPILFTGAAFFIPDLPKIPVRSIHGPALPPLYLGHPASGYRQGSAHRLRNSPGLDRPGPLSERGGGVVSVINTGRKPNGSIMVTIGIDNKPGNDGGPNGQPVKISVKDLNFYYGTQMALDNINLDIPGQPGDGLYRPFGLRQKHLLALSEPDERNHSGDPDRRDDPAGRRRIYAPEVDVVDVRRRVGMVFQKSNPFPKTIFENVAYGLRINGMKDKRKIAEIVERSLMDAAIWDEVKDRLHESAMGLSGGQQQRLCIARALAVEPEVILMDEPASALDPIATQKIEDLIQKLKKKYTIVIVTHNMQQAARVSDITAFFYLGELIEVNETALLFTRPSSNRPKITLPDGSGNRPFGFLPIAARATSLEPSSCGVPRLLGKNCFHLASEAHRLAVFSSHVRPSQHPACRHGPREFDAVREPDGQPRGPQRIPAGMSLPYTV